MSKKTDMLGVEFHNDAKEPSIDAASSLFYIPYYKTEEYFSVYENYCKFVKSCEDLVRKHKFYKTYIKYLIDIVGMKCCQVLPNIEIEDRSDVTVEMHHGPILTLFDTCAIVLDYLRKTGDPYITTFHVADIVIEEHRLNHVRVVLLSKTVHQLVHTDAINLNYKMGFGDTQAFLEKYALGVDKSTRHKINQYIKWSQENDSTDHDVLDIAESMKKFENDFDDFDIPVEKEI